MMLLIYHITSITKLRVKIIKFSEYTCRYYIRDHFTDIKTDFSITYTMLSLTNPLLFILSIGSLDSTPSFLFERRRVFYIFILCELVSFYYIKRSN